MSINILLIIVILAAIGKMVSGYKNGMVKEIISLVSLVILCAVVALIANGIGSYHSGRIFNLIIVIVLLAAIGILHHVLNVVFFSAKVISKLPVIRFANKLLGAVFGVLEVVLLLWTVYVLITIMEAGVAGQVILSFTEESRILSWIFRNNWLRYGLDYLRGGLPIA